MKRELRSHFSNSYVPQTVIGVSGLRSAITSNNQPEDTVRSKSYTNTSVCLNKFRRMDESPVGITQAV
jgi:hypothetical protein